MLESSFGPLPPKPAAWTDVFAITGGLRDVSIKEIERGRIDWEYDFTANDMRHCGRAGCKQVHGHGWIVALPGRRYVHVGNDCARLYANSSVWGAKVATYNERRRAETQAEALILARDKAQAILWWLDSNSELRAAATLYRSFQVQAPGSLLSDLQRRAEKGDFEVRHEVRLSPEEVSRRREAATHIRADGTVFVPSVHATEFVTIGVLRGVRGFRKDVAELARSLERDAVYLLRNAHAAMEKQELSRVREVMNRLNFAQREVEKAIADIERFFEEANLAVLANSPVSRSQGVVEISAVEGKVVIARRSDWGKRAA